MSLSDEFTYQRVIGPESKVTGEVCVVAGTGRPWAVVITTVVAALVAAGALAGAVALRQHRADTSAETDTTETTSTTSGPGADGCYVQPCTVMGRAAFGGTLVQLVVDAGGRSARLQIGGGGSSEVIEATITGMGATLGEDSLQCVPDSLSACLLRGQFDLGVVGQVVVGRSTKWSELSNPFQSDAGYLALSNVTSDVGAEVLVAQHACDRKAVADCSTTPVYIRVYNLRSQELGCTRNYARLESLPDWPTVTLTAAALKPCG